MCKETVHYYSHVVSKQENQIHVVDMLYRVATSSSTASNSQLYQLGERRGFGIIFCACRAQAITAEFAKATKMQYIFNMGVDLVDGWRKAQPAPPKQLTFSIGSKG